MMEAETTQRVKVSSVRESPTNPRERYGNLADLADSIRAHGVLQPIIVRPREERGFELISGHRRLRASKLVGLESVPAIVREMSNADVLEVQLAENLQREDLHPLEEAAAYQNVLSAELVNVEELAHRLGKSKAHVYARLRLLELGKEARKAFLDGELAAAVAMLLTRLDHERQAKALGEMRRDKGGAGMRYVTDAQWTLRRYTHDLRHAPFPTSDTELVADAGACGVCPKRSGNQRDLFGNVDGEDPETCTDPGCFETKIAANAARVKAKAAAKGLRVLEPGEVFGKHGYIDHSRFATAKEIPTEAYKLPKPKNWKQLVGKEVRPAVVQDPRTGEMLEVFDRKEAAAALPEELRRKPGASPEDKRRRAEEERKRAIEREATAALVESVTGDVTSSSDLARAVARCAVRAAWADVRSQAARRRGLDAKAGAAEDSLLRAISDMTIGQAWALVVELLAGRGGLNELCAAARVDTKAIAARVKAETQAAKPKSRKRVRA